jgi:hypothetical protein
LCYRSEAIDEKTIGPRKQLAGSVAVMSLVDHPVALFFVAFAGLLAVVELGYRLASWTSANADEERHEQIVAARTGIEILLSLLLGFTLPMSLPNYDLRKHLVIEEANAIGTTNLRAQMLPEPARGKILGLLREYVDARMEFSKAGPRVGELQACLAHAKQLQNEIWRQSVAAAQQSNSPLTSTFVQALNESIDLSEKRLAALEMRIPRVIWWMLALISLLTCLLVGYSMRRRFLLVMLVSPLMIAIVMGLIADLDSPRSGLIRVSQQSMERLQMDLKDGAANH